MNAVYLTDNYTLCKTLADHVSYAVDIVAIDMNRLTVVVGEAMIAEYGMKEGYEVLKRLAHSQASRREVSTMLQIFYKSIVEVSGKQFNFEAITHLIHANNLFSNDPVFGGIMQEWVKRHASMTELAYPSAA